MNKSTTPTKTVSRPAAVSPKSKESICIHCSEIVSTPDYKRRLFSQSIKTKACVNLEIVVGDTFLPETCVTAFVCRACDRRNDNLVKKILESRERFYASQSKLLVERGCVQSTKRQNRQENDSVKRARALFQSETTDTESVSTTHQPDIPVVSTTVEQSTQTSSCPEVKDSEISAIHVSSINRRC